MDNLRIDDVRGRVLCQQPVSRGSWITIGCFIALLSISWLVTHFLRCDWLPMRTALAIEHSTQSEPQFKRGCCAVWTCIILCELSYNTVILSITNIQQRDSKGNSR